MQLTEQMVSIKQAEMSQRIDVAVMKKSMDAAKAQGKAAMELLESAAAAQPQSPSGPGQGIQLDTSA